MMKKIVIILLSAILLVGILILTIQVFNPFGGNNQDIPNNEQIYDNQDSKKGNNDNSPKFKLSDNGTILYSIDGGKTWIDDGEIQPDNKD